MSDFATYYRNLAVWEGVPEVELVAAWRREDVDAIAQDFQDAFTRSGLSCAVLTVPIGISNQSIGNKVADFLVANIKQYLKAFRIESCSGAGYPDKRLVNGSDRRSFVFELKATSCFDPGDSNRIVLTSSSQKLRRYFQQPIHHLLMTACYEQQDVQIRVRKLRLDFLEPNSQVNVRLEASVSQRFLARGTHLNFLF
jgi:hypothetical protein